MNATFTPMRMRITVDGYQKMVATGRVDLERPSLERIEGGILSRGAVTPRHTSVTARLVKRLIFAVGMICPSQCVIIC
jgi:hypothetical protein